MERPPFRANYYEILGLDPDVKPRAPEIAKALAALEGKSPHATSGTASEQIATTLGKGLLRAMREDLAEDGAPVWEMHRAEWKARKKHIGKEKSGRLAKMLNIVGDAAMPESARQNLAKELDDESVLARALKTSGVTFFNAQKGDDIPPALRGSLKRAHQALVKLAPLMRLEDVSDIWELLSRMSGKEIDERASTTTLADVTEAIKQRANDHQLGREVQASFAFLRPLTDPILNGHDPRDRYASLTLFHELWLLERDMGLFMLLSTFVALERVSRDQFERAVAEAARVAKIDAAHARHLMLGLFDLRKITLPRFAMAQFKPVIACPFCGNLQIEGADRCSACNQSPFVSCANCETLFDAGIGRCAACGVTVAAAAEGRRNLKRAQLYLTEGNWQAARAALDDALKSLPDLDVTKMTKALSEVRRNAANKLGQLGELVAAQKMEQAAKLLKDEAGLANEPDLVRLAATIAQARLESNKLVANAQSLISECKYTEAWRAARAALAKVSDNARAGALLDKIPPTPPTDLTAIARGGDVTLRWMAKDATGDEGYEVRRHLGNDKGGEVISTRRGMSFTDTQCPDGVPVSYSVVATRKSARSDKAAWFGPLTIFRSISELKISPVLKGIELQWRLPKGATHAEIRRYLPDDERAAASQVPVLATAGESWTDRDQSVTGPRTYSLIAAYVSKDGTGHGAEVTRKITPQAPPSAIGSLRRTSGGKLTWPSSDNREDEDVILCFATDETLPSPDSVVHIDDLPEPNATLPRRATSAHEHVVDVSALPLGRFNVVVGRTRGSLVRLTSSLAIENVPPMTEVRNLTARIEKGHVLAEWDWPQGAKSALIDIVAKVKGRDKDTIFEGQSVSAGVGRSGRFRMRKRLTMSCELTLSVRTQAPGTADGPPATVNLSFVKPWMVSAAIRRGSKFAGLRESTHLELTLDKNADAWPDLNVAFRPDAVKDDSESARVLKVVAAVRARSRTKEIDLSRDLNGQKGRLSVELGDNSASGYVVVPQVLSID